MNASELAAALGITEAQARKFIDRYENLTAKASSALGGQQDGISVDNFASAINASSTQNEA